MSREDWIDAGLRLLVSEGEAGITVERLCQTMRRTKGSFYHHFADVAAYHAALLGSWAERNTELFIAASSRGEPAERRRALYRAVRDVDVGAELAVHAWAIRSPTARTALERVHRRRIAYLAELLGGDDAAERRAELEYATLLGALHLYPDDPRKQQAILARLSGRSPASRG